MTQTIAVPLWMLVLILVLAAASALTHVLVPSVRWFFRRRMERVVSRLNARLDRPIAPFKLMARPDMITRLVHDAGVMAAVVDQARATGVPETVVFQQAHGYAREIVPSFSATVYFGFATRAARLLTRAFYRVRVGRVDAAIAGIDRQATVVFIMNHRSNMDYVLVTWLVAERSALSYAVGEWARVWPLSRLIRAMGAYFIRRKAGTPLYRRVLARYVQMATAEGTTQAIFPEGGLSLDGRVGAAKLGLLGYIVDGFAAVAESGGRDVVFVPVGLAYDRVIEDRMLVEAGQTGVRRFRARPLSILGFLIRTIWRKIIGRFPGFGTVAVNFGAPVSLSGFLAAVPGGADAQTAALGLHLMDRVVRGVPVLAVPLVAAALADGPVARADLPARIGGLVADLIVRGAHLELPPGGGTAEGLRMLITRGIVEETGGTLCCAPGMGPMLEYHAAGVRQLLEQVLP